MTDAKAAVVIPALNEENNIRSTIEALQSSACLNIVVVDNGSADSTPEIARALGVKVIVEPEATISGLRNRGVAATGEPFLVFLDADITVADDWHDRLPQILDELSTNPRQITGSRVLAPDDEGIVNRFWYSKLTDYSAAYINSGHLITSRQLFDTINGFTEVLKTGEDYDFCQKAVRAGAEINPDPTLRVFHHGYPTSIVGLILRERWHGSEDVRNLASFGESRTAWLAALNLLFALIGIAATLAGYFLALPIYLAVMYFVCLVLTLMKFGYQGVAELLPVALMFFFYLCGRSWSIVDRLLGCKP